MKLRYYQEDAVSKAWEELNVADRATLIMCCGSGKTLVGIEVTNRLKANKIMVVAPTILLAEQLKNIWLARQHRKVIVFNSSKKIDYKDLCNEIKSSQSIVVITTYHSANLCVNAFDEVKTKIDLSVYDEAHRTAGKFQSLFNKVIKRDDVISKHLFMTATPKNAIFESDDIEFFSMDEESQYGRVCYTYSLRRAINDKVVADYRVLVSHVDQNDLRKSIFSDDEKHYYAIAYSLKKAIEKFSLKKIITFHSSIKNAKKLASIFSDVIDDFSVFHISSSQSAKLRDENLSNYAKLEKAIITNVRCFGEGIDVPDTDAAMFCEEKSSTIDITQNIGRAIRRSDKKDFGYIIIPALVDENSVGLGDYSSLLNIVHTLSENDEELANVIKLRFSDKEKYLENINKFIFTYDDFSVSAKELENRIYVKIMDSPKSFYDRLEDVKEFVKKHGHARIGVNNCNDNSLLGWIKYNRKLYKENLLSKAKISMLNKVGFVWNVNEERFHRKFNEMLKFINENKENLPRKGDSIKYPKKLIPWITSLRERYSKGDLQEKYVKVLQEIGFDFNPLKNMQAKQDKKIKEIFEHLANNKKMNESLNKDFIRFRVRMKSKTLRGDLVNKIQEYEKKYNVNFFMKIDNSISDDIKNEAIKLYKSGLSTVAVSKALNGAATSGVISVWIRSAGISRKKIITEEMKNEIVQLSLEGVSTKNLAEKYNLAMNTILKIRSQKGVVYDTKTRKFFIKKT